MFWPIKRKFLPAKYNSVLSISFYATLPFYCDRNCHHNCPETIGWFIFSFKNKFPPAAKFSNVFATHCTKYNF